MPAIEAIIASPLQRIFPDWRPVPLSVPLTLLGEDVISFQVAVRWNGDYNIWAHIRAECAAPAALHVRAVMLSPGAYPAPPATDGGYERTAPGLFPDRLAELDKGRVKLAAGQYRALWVDVETAAVPPSISKFPPPPVRGTYPIKITGTDDTGNLLFLAETEVEIIPVNLPERRVYHTEWLHADCLADYYNVPVFSDRHFEIVENFIRTALRRGVNTILTPLFTYPLDTAEGGERTTAQLIGVKKDGEDYTFDFSLLERWVAMGERLGVGYYEMSHLFSQWGAKYAPKIIAAVDGAEQKLFGWHTGGGNPEYKAFLAAFLPALDKKLREWDISKRCFFHISDEPERKDLPAYLAAKETVAALLPGYPLIDAVSDFDFYREGASEHPIPAIDRIAPFLESGAEGLWTYYCVAQKINVSNRFFSMPLSRARVLGAQLYKYKIAGFLHWGYNFYNAQFSERHINPYAVTDAGEAFPSGDAFLVYPGADGQPEESIRLMAMDAAFRDIRALDLLERLTSRDEVVRLIDRFLDTPTLTAYPYGDGPLLELRAEVNRRVSMTFCGIYFNGF
jgi:hypothetical protein